MASPLGTTRRRRIAVFLLLWTVTILSVILWATTPRPIDTLGIVVRALGLFYAEALQLLLAFVVSSGIPQWVVILAYWLLGLVAVGIALYLLDNYAVETPGTFVRTYLYLCFYAVMLVPGTLLVLWLVSLATAMDPLSPVVAVLTDLGPRVLVVAVIGVVISFVTGYVP